MRPRTLPAAVIPVVLGSLLAWREGLGIGLAAGLCLSFAVLVQIGTNFANDYFDWVKGAETPERIGPTRAVAAGLIEPATMLRATIGVLAVALGVGCALIPYGGWELIGVGLVSVLCAIGYTGGPYPLAYRGLGDLFVFVFFGLVAVGFTFFVQAGYFSTEAWIIGAGVGALATNILCVNNLRDRDTDRRANKRTLVVRFGRRFALAQYQLGFAAAMGALFILWARHPHSSASGNAINLLWGCVLIPEHWRLSRRLVKAEKTKPVGLAFNEVLKGTARLLVLYGLLLGVGLLLSQ